MFAVPENTVPDPIDPVAADSAAAGSLAARPVAVDPVGTGESPGSRNSGVQNTDAGSIGSRGAALAEAASAGRTPAHPVRIAQEFAASRDVWAPLLRYDPDQRWVGLLERTEQHEVWLLSWLPGQHTPLHDHGGATGAFTVVSGTLSERAFPLNRGAVETWHHLIAGQSRVFGPSYVHQVRNDGPDPAVSVHVYRPARSRMTVYFQPPTA